MEAGVRDCIWASGVGGGRSGVAPVSVGRSVVDNLPGRVVRIWEDGLDNDYLSSLLDVADDCLDFLFWGRSVRFLVVADGQLRVSLSNVLNCIGVGLCAMAFTAVLSVAPIYGVSGSPSSTAL